MVVRERRRESSSRRRHGSRSTRLRLMICLGRPMGILSRRIHSSTPEYDLHFQRYPCMHHERKQYTVLTEELEGTAELSIHAGRRISDADARRNSHVCIASPSDSRLRTPDYLSITFVSLPKTPTARIRASLHRVQSLTAHFGTFACFSIRKLRHGSRVASNIILPLVRGSDQYYEIK